MATVSDVKRRIESMERWIAVLKDGLEGKPHTLGAGEGDAMEKVLSRTGLVLLSETKAKREGLVLRRGAQHVVSRYYGAPIQQYYRLYLLEQFKPKPQAKGNAT